jgi:two-component system nitrogen regulation response regulator NtrX
VPHEPPAVSAQESSPAVGSKPFRDLVDDAERAIILRTLAFTGDNVTEAARLLDLERGHFYKKMKALGLRRSGPPEEPAAS